MRGALLRGAGLLLAVLVAGGVPALGGETTEPLVLRVSDAVGRPGGLTTIVVRTYSPRPVGQGQIDLRASGPRAAGEAVPEPIAAIEEVRVFAAEDDATWFVDLSGGTEIDLDIASPSATLNEFDGPLFALQVRLQDDLVPGESWILALAPGTTVSNANGQPIPLELRSGELQIVAPAAPFAVEADGDRVAPGGRFVSGVNTLEPLALGSARFGLRIDPSLLYDAPKFRADPRYGQSTLSVTHPEADLWVVELTSPDGSLNRVVTGSLVEWTANASTALEIGTSIPIVLDPSETLVEDASGMPLTLDLADGVVEIVPDEPVFRDGFESGDALAW